MAKKNGNGESTEIAHYDRPIPGIGRVSSSEEMAALLAGGEVLPRVHALEEEGAYVQGLVVGPGQEVPYTDAAGDERALKTWRIEVAPGTRVDVLSAYELDKSLPALVGHKVTVVKGPTKKVGARQINQYLISDQGAP